MTQNSWNSPDPVNVPHGGTGNSTATAYAVQCGGTSSTANFQSIASVGNLGEVLTSRGASTLPIMAEQVFQLLDAETASVDADIQFLDLDNTDGVYFFSLDTVRPATNNVILQMNLSSDGGMTWISSGYQSTLLYNAYNSTTNVVSSSTATIVLGAAIEGGSTSSTGSYQFYFSESGSEISTITGTCCFTGQSTIMQHGRIASYVPVPASNNFNSFQFIMSSGNITIGNFKVYKVRKTSPV